MREVDSEGFSKRRPKWKTLPEPSQTEVTPPIPPPHPFPSLSSTSPQISCHTVFPPLAMNSSMVSMPTSSQTQFLPAPSHFSNSNAEFDAQLLSYAPPGDVSFSCQPPDVPPAPQSSHTSSHLYPPPPPTQNHNATPMYSPAQADVPPHLSHVSHHSQFAPEPINVEL